VLQPTACYEQGHSSWKPCRFLPDSYHYAAARPPPALLVQLGQELGAGDGGLLEGLGPQGLQGQGQARQIMGVSGRHAMTVSGRWHCLAYASEGP
jgi:hypothetical protein